MASNVQSEKRKNSNHLPLHHHHHHHQQTSSVKSRLLTTFLICLILTSLPSYMFLRYHNGATSGSTYSVRKHDDFNNFRQAIVEDEELLSFKDHDHRNLTDLIPDQGVISGGSIMPKMANATAKAELGRATWKFMHTLTARFPEKPTEDERAALKAFIYLFSRLYPCGDCARHFQALLKKYPPQTSSRNAASLHLCSLHNLVNERLGKPQYNCTSLAENYDCGCGHDESEAKKAKNISPISSFH
ncbi:ERV/ALR sulfhydryl oxidase domain-containing protein [Phakopsora pachyrhizi]|uniref:Sulfhydryl oxidase n=1 Tax=Phakopsora pachyrhizi TaxID=170000 RepID=A0AAV0BHV2_PHAPC|nr:ERV/ALR sulfhydryl oxidase domain-containing protein [Phakopsora pachyrhizi]CAH7686016.1 ERV/ALR sulfhydryl oxidase domain-containing protein [Phakopsora pachyrhizi]